MSLTNQVCVISHEGQYQQMDTMNEKTSSNPKF